MEERENNVGDYGEGGGGSGREGRGEKDVKRCGLECGLVVSELG